VSRTVEVRTYVEVELSEIDESDLLEELKSRLSKGELSDAGLAEIPPLGSEERHPLHSVYYSLKTGDEKRALEQMRAYLCDELGVVL